MDFSHAVVELDDGTSVFAKHGTGETIPFLETEIAVYESVAGAWLPEFVGVEREGAGATLVLEDLSWAKWPPAWDDELISGAHAALVSVHDVPTPDAVAQFPPVDPSQFPTWSTAWERRDTVRSALDLPEAWLQSYRGPLGDLAEEARFGPIAFVHGDAHGGNVCALTDRAAVWVDWSSAHVGDPDEDFALLAVSIAADDGPVVKLSEPALAHVAFDAALWLARAGEPAPSWGPGMKRIEAHLWRGALRVLAAAGCVEPPV
jgi:hypothetical protein